MSIDMQGGNDANPAREAAPDSDLKQMTNSERIANWREERARVADDARAERLRIAETDREKRIEEARRKRQEEIDAEETARLADAARKLPVAETIEIARLALLQRRKLSQRASFMRLAALVGLPTLLVALYLAVVATPLYETEAIFTVQTLQDSTSTPSAGIFGMAMTSSSLQDAFKAREYILSREMMERIEREHRFLSYFRTDRIDPVSRLFTSRVLGLDELDYYRRRVKVGVDVQEGILRLHVQARSGRDAATFAKAILGYAEEKVNLMSTRIREDQTSSLVRDTDATEQTLQTARRNIAGLQVHRGELSPRDTTAAIYQLIANLEMQKAEAERERDVILQAKLEDSPVLARLNARLAALGRQIAEQRVRLVGGGQSLNKTLGEFEHAEIAKDIAQKRWESSLRMLENAHVEALRQRRYFMVIADPLPPSMPTTPRLAKTTFLAFILFAGLYGLISVFGAALRSSKRA